MGEDCPCAMCRRRVDRDHGALRCDGCEGWVHYLCSGLPVYQLILLAGSARKYLCSACVNNRFGDYMKKNAMFQNLIDVQRQEFSRRDAEEDGDSSKPEDAEDAVWDGEPRDGLDVCDGGNTRVYITSRSQSEVNNKRDTNSLKDSKKAKKVCRYFLQSKCKHGRKGSDCKFPHPKLCKRFTQNGSDEGGCREGEECKYFHPPLCRGSERDKRCSREKCHFFHLIGTVRSMPDATTTDANRRRDRENKKSPYNTKGQNPIPDRNIKDGRSDFLKELHAIKEAIRELQIQHMMPRLPMYVHPGNHGMIPPQFPNQSWTTPGIAPVGHR